MLNIFSPVEYLKTFAITYVAGIATAALVVLYVKFSSSLNSENSW